MTACLLNVDPRLRGGDIVGRSRVGYCHSHILCHSHNHPRHSREDGNLSSRITLFSIVDPRLRGGDIASHSRENGGDRIRGSNTKKVS